MFKSIAVPISLFVIASASFWVGAGDAPVFMSPKARDAKAAYLASLHKADDDYRLRLAQVRKEYHDALTQAQSAATKKGDLDEAIRIRDELTAIDAEAKSQAPSPNLPARPKLVISRARYGAGDRWVDITKLLTTQIHSDTIQQVQNIPDPAPGIHKLTLIEGTFGGQDFVLSFPEEFPLNHLIFGKPPKRADAEK